MKKVKVELSPIALFVALSKLEGNDPLTVKARLELKTQIYLNIDDELLDEVECEILLNELIS